MSKPVALIILIIVASVFAIGAEKVFGEEQFYYEPKFKFPMPAQDNIDTILEQCGVKEINDIKMHVQCNFIVGFGDDGYGWYVELIDKFGLSAEDKQRKDLGIEDQPPKTPLTHEDIDQIKLEEKVEKGEELSATEQEYLALLQEYAECYRGYDQARGIQTEGSFRVGAIQMDNPEWAPENISREWTHSKLAMAVQECLAQRVYLLPMLGDYRAEGDVQSRQSWFGTEQPYHGTVKDVPAVSSERVMAEAQGNMDFVAKTPHDILCESEYVTKRYKIDQNCEDFIVYFNCNDCTVEYESEAMLKFNQYKADGGESMKKELAAEKIQERRAELASYLRSLP